MLRNVASRIVAFAAIIVVINVPDALTVTAGDPAPRAVRVGVANSMFTDQPESQIGPINETFKSLTAAHFGIAGEVVIGGDFRNLASRLKEGKVQLGVFHSFEYAWVRLVNPDFRPLAVFANHQPFSHAVLVVRTDTKAADVFALKGKALALPRQARGHCRLFVERRCVWPGLALDKWFSKILAPNTARDALDDVAEGHAAAAVVEDVDLTDFRKEYPKTSGRLRVLVQSEAFPCPIIAYKQGGVDEAALAQMRVGLMAARITREGRELLDRCRSTGFELVPADFEKMLAEILKAYPPAER